MACDPCLGRSKGQECPHDMERSSTCPHGGSLQLHAISWLSTLHGCFSWLSGSNGLFRGPFRVDDHPQNPRSGKAAKETHLPEEQAALLSVQPASQGESHPFTYTRLTHELFGLFLFTYSMMLVMSRDMGLSLFIGGGSFHLQVWRGIWKSALCLVLSGRLKASDGLPQPK